MKIRLKKEKFFTFAMYVLLIAVYLVTYTLYGMGNSDSRIRYYVLAFVVVMSFVSLIFKNGLNIFSKKYYSRELLWTIGLGILFYLVSVDKAKITEVPLNIRVYVQIALVLLPALYCYCLVNLLSIKEIIRLMKITTFFLIVIYFFESKHTPLQFLNIENWANISFMRSISFTESNLCAEPFLQLFLFFFYFLNINDKDINKVSLRRYAIITFVFTLLSFKRLGVLFAICIVLLKKIVDFRGEVSKKMDFVLAVAFTGITILYIKFLFGEIFSGVDVYHLTSGRNYWLTRWQSKGFVSYGFGTSMYVIGKYLEMDLVQIYYELDLLCLFLFCFVFFRIAKKNVYSLIIMIYVFCNMITASGLPYSLNWIILLLTVSCISSNKCADENIDISMNMNRYRKLFQKKEA